MSMKGVNKALATVNAVAKKSVKVFGNALPILSVAANVADAVKSYPGDLVGIGNTLILRYTGVDMKTGQWHQNEVTRGLGTLGVSLVTRKIINTFA